MAATHKILEPSRPIIDPHHHLWDRSRLDLRDMPFAEHGFSQMLRERSRYMLDELLADTFEAGSEEELENEFGEFASDLEMEDSDLQEMAIGDGSATVREGDCTTFLEFFQFCEFSSFHSPRQRTNEQGTAMRVL